MSAVEARQLNIMGLPLGTEITLKFRVAGLVDFGREIQLEAPDGLLTYLPVDTVLKQAEYVK